MPKFRKKPVVIEAMQWFPRGSDASKVRDWLNSTDLVGKWSTVGFGADCTILIPTLEGTMAANPGDWIIKGVQGEFYPCKPDIFENTYEEETND